MVSLLNLTMSSLLRRAAEKYPRESAIWFDGEETSYEELEAQVIDCAGKLLALGVHHGDKVALVSDIRPQGIVAMYAVEYIGAVAVMLNTSLSPSELLSLIEQTEPSMLILGYSYSGEGHFEKLFSGVMLPSCVKNVLSLYPGVWAFPVLGALPGTEESVVRACGARVDPQDTAMVLFTSGSTSRPKAVCTTHYSRINSGVMESSGIAMTHTDRVLSAMPIFHCFGISANLMSALVSGACLCIPENRRTVNLMNTIERARCTVVNCVPTMYLAMLSKDYFTPERLKTVRIGTMAGAGYSPEDFELIDKSLGESFTLMASLGQTECTAGFTTCDMTDPLSVRSNTVGHFMPHIEGKIVDMATGEALPVGKVGEICVRGFLVMQGYYGDDEATTKTVDADGWVHTGDLGVVDENGNITLKGRCKELIIRGGENISPLEIEQALLKHPGIKECKVVGVPDRHFGEEICAFIIPAVTPAPTADEVRDYLRPLVAYFKLPRYVIAKEELPRTSKGAISAPECRKLARKELLGEE